MTTTNKIRIATADTTNACKLACSEITAAVGLTVHPEFQEIEGDCLILELRLGANSMQPRRNTWPQPSAMVRRLSIC